MALPPTIPTSFAPHPADSARRFRPDLTGAFGFFAYAIFVLVLLLAVGVFFYGHYILASTKASKDAALKSEVDKIDQATVENFLRLRNRLTSGKKLMNDHIAFSSFFSSLEKIMPATVRFNSLNLSSDSTGLLKMDGSGLAKNFNALAAASMAFAADGRIKDAIFSSIKINSDSSVSFSLAATLDPKIVAFTP